MPHKPPDWLDKAIAMRHDGGTLQAIADELGITREAVRQQLKKHLGTTKFPDAEAQGYALADSEVFEEIVGAETIAKWGKHGRVPTKRFGGSTYYDIVAVLDRFVQLMDRPCDGPGCTNVVGTLNERQRYCHTCSVEKARYDYPFLTAERKKRAHSAAQAWQVRNPERAHKTNRVAQEKFSARQRAERAGPEVRSRLDQLLGEFRPRLIDEPEQAAAVEARVDELAAGEMGMAERLYLDLLRKRLHTWQLDLAERHGFVGYLNTPEGRERFPEGRFPGKMRE